MSNETSSAPSGQEPTATAAPTGQEPAVANANDTPKNAPASQPTADEWRAHQERLRVLEAELKEARGDAAKYRQERKAREDAELSELQKAARDRDEAAARATKLAERIVASEVKLQAQALGFLDPADALSFLDRNQLKLDDDGNPTNAEDLLKDLAARKPYLLKAASPDAQGAPPKPAPPSAGAAMNPARSQQQGVQTPLTVQQARSIRLGAGVFGTRAS